MLCNSYSLKVYQINPYFFQKLCHKLCHDFELGKFLFNSMLNDLELRSYWFYKLQTYWLLQASTLFSYYYNRYNVCIMDMHAYIYTQTMDILKPLLPFTLLRALTVRGVHGSVRSVLERFFAPHLWGAVSPNA